jgi:hypothetical protein
VTTENGDYIVPFLPAGEYTVQFEISGFATVRRTVRLVVAETVPLDIQMVVGAVSETVEVSAATQQADFTSAPTVAASCKAAVLDTLPVPRTVNGAVLLAPGTSNTGPGGNVTFSGPSRTEWSHPAIYAEGPSAYSIAMSSAPAELSMRACPDRRGSRAATLCRPAPGC